MEVSTTMAFINKYVVCYPPDNEDNVMITRYTTCLSDRVGINIIYRDTGFYHSHPWGFISVILWGGYKESIIKFNTEIKIWRGVGSIAYRPYNLMHTIEVPKKAITLFIRGKQKVKSTKVVYDGAVMSDTKMMMKQGFTKAQIKQYVKNLIGK